MRVGIAILVSCISVLPVAAHAGAALRGEAPLPSPSTKSVTLSPGFRLTTTTVASSGIGQQLADGDSAVRKRFDSSMIDFYPDGGEGFHVSAGLRLVARHDIRREQMAATGGLLYNPRGVSSATSGGRRYTPTATFGYTTALAKDMEFGIEGGAVMGRMLNAAAGVGSTRAMGAYRLYPGQGMNPIARATFGMRF